jgi:hypothetical protein
MFSRTDLLNSRFSCSTTPTWRRSHLRAAVELLVEPAAPYRHGGDDDDRPHRDSGQHHDGELPAVEPHHHDEDRGEDDVEPDGQRLAGQELADVLKLAHAGHRIADPSHAEVAERQAHEMAEQPGAQLDVDAVGGVGQHVGAQPTQQDLEYRDHHQAEHQHVERAPALVDQHLVDHDLGEERRDQAEELQEQRADQRLAQQAAEPHDRGDEPGEIEGAGGADQPLARGHQDELAAPAGVERRALLDRRTVGGEVLQQHAIVGDARQQRERSVVHQGDGRQGGLCQALGRRALATRLDLQALGGAQNMVGRETLAVGRELMTQLREVGGFAQESEERDECQQAAIQRHLRRCGALGHFQWLPSPATTLSQHLTPYRGCARIS